MAKQIRSFTVDKKTCDMIVNTFKRHKADVSLSSYIDGCLKELLAYLRNCEAIIESHVRFQEYNYLMSEMVKRIMYRESRIPSEEHINTLLAMLEQAREEIDAVKNNFTVRLYKLLRTGGYEISKDQKYVYDVKNKSKKFYVFQTKDGLLDIDTQTLSIDRGLRAKR